MKKHILFFVLIILLVCCTLTALASDDDTVGVLTYLNMTENEYAQYSRAERTVIRQLISENAAEITADDENFISDDPTIVYYDSLNGMLMALMAEDITSIDVPLSTAAYLCNNSDYLKMPINFHPDPENTFQQSAYASLEDNFSFMLLEGKEELRGKLNTAISAMKEDGTLDALIDEYINSMVDSGEIKTVAIEQKDRETIRVGVTGSLPPMDYIAPDGSFAGFNTAVLAEISNRLDMNVELLEVDSIGRAAALSSGTVDVVFWTRTLTAEQNSHSENDAAFTDEERQVMADISDIESSINLTRGDMPDGTIITESYFSDINVPVVLR